LPRRVLIAEDAFEFAGAAATAALQPALERIAMTLGKPQRVHASPQGLRRWLEVFRVLQGFEIWAQHGAWVQEAHPNLGPGIRQRVQWAATIAAGEAEKAKREREEVATRVATLVGDDAVLALPTVPDIAPLRGADPQAT